MAQNIYDEEAFFDAYNRLPRSKVGLKAAPEWPVLRSMLPDLADSTVLDLGCGAGAFCRWARAHGAARVLGIDLSERMLARARQGSDDPGLEFEIGNLETVALPPCEFDLVYSALAFHYVEDAQRLYHEIFKVLKPGGRLVFSTEHPIYMAPRRPEWRSDEDGLPAWQLNAYSMEGARTTDWLVNGVVKYHRTIATTLNLLIGSGFLLERVDEFKPTDAQVEAKPALSIERERPMFLLISARRRD